jgi:hypothetical protein
MKPLDFTVGLRYLTGAALLATAAAACGSSSGSNGSASGGSAGSGGSAPLITIALPPDVESRLTKLIDDLTVIVCQRSRNCCANYGFSPLSDCRNVAGGPLVLAVSQVLFDGPDNFDYAVDEASAAACLDAARAVVDDCTFATEPLFYAWTDACQAALRITKKGETRPPSACKNDSACVAQLGPGSRCYAEGCVPTSEVATGSSCAVPSTPTSIPICGAADYCNGSFVCAPRFPLGAACQGKDTCVEPYACVYQVVDADNAADLCAEKAAVGQRCVRDDQCLEGHCVCSADVGCAAYVCRHYAHFGDACKTDDDCYGATATCVNARCTPLRLSLCQ